MKGGKDLYFLEAKTQEALTSTVQFCHMPFYYGRMEADDSDTQPPPGSLFSVAVEEIFLCLPVLPRNPQDKTGRIVNT